MLRVEIQTTEIEKSTRYPRDYLLQWSSIEMTKLIIKKGIVVQHMKRCNHMGTIKKSGVSVGVNAEVEEAIAWSALTPRICRPQVSRHSTS